MALVIALVMLTALGLLAAWGIKAGTLNVRMVGGMQSRQEVTSAAQTVLERTLSSAEFSQQPAAVAAVAIPVDVDGDGVTDITGTLSPQPACYRVRAVAQAALDAAVAADLACLRSSSSANAGLDTGSSSSGDSLCADSEWQVRVVAADPRTGASVAVVQGVAIRGLITDATNACP